MEQFDVPVVMIVFKRLELTKRSFEPIRKLKPKKLYIIADGPRTEADKEKVIAVREYLDTHVDWDCEVHRNYAEKNMGLRYRMPSGMQWVFESEERAIFIEDDIDATENFFYFCRDMLEHYKDDERVLMISGSNIFPNHESFNGEDIGFSMFASIWGWACWKRSYELYDVNLRSWPEIRKRGMLKKKLTPEAYDFFRILFDDLQYHWYRTWGYQWTYLMLTGKGLGIVPRCNLISNIGMGDADAEHKDDSQEFIDKVSNAERGEMILPITYPSDVIRNEAYDLYYQKDEFIERASLFKTIKYGFRAWYYSRVYRQIKEMERDEVYFNKYVPEKYRLSPEEQKYNKGDRYRLVTPKEMIKSADEYRRYKRKHHIK